jgi:hypothetical protein
VDDFGVMDQAIDEGNDTSGIGKYFRPFCERLVGGYQRAFLLVPTVDQFEQQVGMAVRVGQVADFIDDQ